MLTLSTAEPSSAPYPPMIPTKAFEIVPPRELGDAMDKDAGRAVANALRPAIDR
jgi:hypothetical protein